MPDQPDYEEFATEPERYRYRKNPANQPLLESGRVLDLLWEKTYRLIQMPAHPNERVI